MGVGRGRAVQPKGVRQLLDPIFVCTAQSAHDQWPPGAGLVPWIRGPTKDMDSGAYAEPILDLAVRVMRQSPLWRLETLRLLLPFRGAERRGNIFIGAP
ncbi:hypothetical protein NDU88_005467 [Pleurodeles waltl]|uniref:Uncharacterized protein n=1 Tax=Pleurodeles waltl TaxID=8319 RepID=A0AAV7RLJ2_PLEWA|nr:hypothetical protein NDU88_005467 [Pleurodeles waltl]